MVDIKAAAGAYTNVLDQIKKDSVPEQASGDSFSSLLKNSIDGAIDAQHKSEQVSASAVNGTANITDVLQAVTEAEMTLNTVVAIRDRVISAYETVLRSPI